MKSIETGWTMSDGAARGRGAIGRLLGCAGLALGLANLPAFAQTPSPLGPQALSEDGNSGAETYRDPQGRFGFRVPAQWRVTPLGEQGAQASGSGGAFVAIVAVPGGGKDDSRIKAVVNQVGAQWHSFHRGESGNHTLAGQPSFYVFFDGVNPIGVQAKMLVVGARFADDAYLLLMSAPAAEFAQHKEQFAQIEHSFTLGSGTATAPPSPTQPPQVTAAPATTPAPAALQAADGPAGGHMLFGSLGPASSGAAAFKAGLHQIRGYFDQSPELLNGVDSKDGSVRMVMFAAMLHGAPQAGLVVATSDAASGSRVGFVFDSPDRLGKTLGPMQQQLRKITLEAAESAHPVVDASGKIDLAGLAEAAKSIPLTEVQFPDGTGSFGVAEGYTPRRAQMGVFYVDGPDGAFVNCGGGIPLIDPRGGTYQSWLRLMAMTPNFHAVYPGLLISYIDNPAEAWATARSMDARKQQQPDPQIRFALQTKMNIPPGPAGVAGILVSGTEVINSTPMIFFGTLLTSRPTPEGSWVITVSVVHAPAAHAAVDLPVLWAMRQSLKIDVARLFANAGAISRAMFEQSNARMQAEHDAFMANMQEGFERSMARARATQDAIDRSAAAMTRYAGDTTVVRYNPTSEHWVVGVDWGDRLVRDDPENFSAVPMTEYVKGVDY